MDAHDLPQRQVDHQVFVDTTLAGVLDDGRDADAIAYDREPAEYRHCRLLDHPRGDWADTIARRYLYDTADAVRLEAVVGSVWAPLAELAAKIRREERYHLMHVGSWLERLALGGGESRPRLEAALGRLAPDVATVFAPLGDGDALVEAGILAAPMEALDVRWRASIEPTFRRLGLALLPPATDPARGRLDHSAAFAWLHDEFTMVRRLDPVATW